MARTEHCTRLGPDKWIAATVAGDGPAVLLLHGIPGSAAVWRTVADRLSLGHRVITPDLIGFGASSRSERVEDLWADSQAAAVSRLLDDLSVETATVVGHDFGGPVAAHLVGEGPDRVAGLVLSATNAFGDTPVPFPLSGIRWPLVGKAWERLVFSAPSLRMMVRQGVGRRGPRLDSTSYVGDSAQARAIATIFGSALRELGARYAPISERLRRVRVPTTVVWGDRDPFFPVAQAERTTALIPGADLLILSGAGHFLPEERPQELAEAIAGVAMTSSSLSALD